MRKALKLIATGVIGLGLLATVLIFVNGRGEEGVTSIFSALGITVMSAVIYLLADIAESVAPAIITNIKPNASKTSWWDVIS